MSLMKHLNYDNEHVLQSSKGKALRYLRKKDLEEEYRPRKNKTFKVAKLSDFKRADQEGNV